MTGAMTMTQEAAEDLVGEIEAAGAKIRSVCDAAGTVIFGQEKIIELSLITVLAGGHALLIGVPGLAKTSLVETLATVLGLDSKRIQFTPDLMPTDIVGSEILEEDASGRRHFRFVKGPIFTQLLMADEINRASPKTQSALLQAMQERHVTVAGERYDLAPPFHVLATQNPLEQEGTYPLPEAQLDRFLMQIDVDYPDEAAERRMLLETTGSRSQSLSAILSAQELMRIQDLVRQMPVGETVVEAILKLVRNARPQKQNQKRSQSGIADTAVRDIDRYIAWAPGPRASQAFMVCARARALLDGRLSPSIDDILALAEPILKHRMALTFAARAEGVTISDVIAELKKAIG